MRRSRGSRLGATELGAEISAIGHGAELGATNLGAELVALTPRPALFFEPASQK